MATPIPSVAGVPAKWRWRFLALFLIFGIAAFRLYYLLCLCPFDLAPDEAHYWDWSRHLDWSYYSKGPLVAYLIRLGCLTVGGWAEALTGSQMAAVRLPAVVCGSLLLLSLYILAAQVLRRESLAFLVILLASTMPLVAAGALIMTIDSPYTCCWGWALVLSHQVLFRRSVWAWPLLGFVVGIGILAKYTMILFFPSLILFLLFTPEFRRFLIHPGFWISVGVGVLCCFPIVWWNIQHDWIALSHVRGHAGMQQARASIHWFGPLKYVGLQFAILLGFWFIAWVRAVWDRAPWKCEDDGQRFLWWMSVPMFVFFLLFSFFNGGGEPNWPITCYLSGSVLVCGWLSHRLHSAGRLDRGMLTTGAVLTSAVAVALTLYVHWPDAVYPFVPTPADAQSISALRRVDPTCRLRGWRELAQNVDAEFTRLRKQGIEPIVIGNRWNIPGEIGFYSDNHPQVYCIGPAFGDRHSQYDLWRPNPVADVESFRGRTFVYVGDPTRLRHSQAFGAVEPTRLIRHSEQGHVLAVWQITVFHDFRGFSPVESVRY